MSADKYPSIFSRQMEVIVYILVFNFIPTSKGGCHVPYQVVLFGEKRGERERE